MLRHHTQFGISTSSRLIIVITIIIIIMITILTTTITAKTTTVAYTTHANDHNYNYNDDDSVGHATEIASNFLRLNSSQRQQQQQQQQQQNIKYTNNADPVLMTPLKLIVEEGLRETSTVQILQQQHQQYINTIKTPIDLTKSLQLNDLLNIFDLDYLSQRWPQITTENTNDRALLSFNCSEDMYTYLMGLRNGSIWAMKMDDASGHYPTGFYYGNNYLMGSMLLCKSIYKEENVEQRNLTQMKMNVPVFSKNYQRTYNENPPFLPGFFVLRMILNETYPTNLIRTIYEGLCLPSSCTIKDIHYIAKLAQRDLNVRQIHITNVRMPSSTNYNVYNDLTFKILASVTIMVFILILSGSLYEIYLRRRLKIAMRLHNKEMMNNSETSSGIGCPSSSDYGESMINGSNADADADADADTDDEQKHNGNTLKNLNIVLNLPQMARVCETKQNSNNNNNHNSHNKHNITNGNDIDEHLEGHIQVPNKLSVYSELLLSFSAITNLKAICDPNVGADTLASIHGLRAISMGWVMLGHTCMVVFYYSDNLELRKEVETSFLFKVIANAPFSVDTFFFISGCLVSYLYFRTDAKGKLNKLSSNNEIIRCAGHFFGLITYRFMRLTAPYMFVLGIVQVAHKYWAATSVFEAPTMDHITCSKYWWRNLLYINTLFPLNQMCMVWSWYLANDTQFYIIGAIILIIGVRHFKISAITSCVLLALSWIITAVIAFTHNHRPNTDDPFALFDKIYDKPWTRSGPYLIGMAVGWILFRTNCKIRLPRFIVITAWLLACTNLIILAFGLYGGEQSQFTGALYSSLSHSMWAFSLAWITIACSTGYGGYINMVLSCPFIYPLSRVTYCAYLIHPIIIRSLAMNTDSPLHLGCYAMAIYFFGMCVTSYIAAFAVSMAFEAPVVTMLKILSPSRKRSFA